MPQSESLLSRKIKHALRARGHFVWKNHGSRFTEPGVSDLTGSRFGDGRFIAIETKLKTQVSEAQWRFIREINFRSFENAITGIAHSVDEAIAIVETPDWLKTYGSRRRQMLDI